jgi:cell division protein FtsB
MSDQVTHQRPEEGRTDAAATVAAKIASGLGDTRAEGGRGNVSTMRASSGEEKSGRRRGFMAAITEHWLPFLTAVLVLATAVVGLYAQRATSERNRFQDDSASLEAQVRQLSATNSELEAENAKLRQQLEDATNPTADTSPEVAGVLRQTGASPLVVPGRDGVDLDSQASNWGVDSAGKGSPLGYVSVCAASSAAGRGMFR